MMKTFTKFISRKGQIFRFSLLTLFLCVSSVLLAQEQIIVGKVLDEDGSGLPGATIIEKGTSNGSTTDLDGNYRLAVPNNSTLIYSFVGYVTAEIPVGNRTTIDMSMELDVRALAEIVVVGYGTVEKGDVTGVVNKVSAENFNKGVITSPDQLLVGKVAGVSIIPNSGEPGGQVSIKMRGGTSISLSNEPLFVIDGVPLDNTPFNPGGFSQGRNPLNFINPSDVESITVLKDASAAAIYGSRGANGVIIITTKTGGNSDKPKVTYDGSIGISSFVDEVDIFTADEFRQVVRVYGSRNEDKLGDANTDWLSEIVQGAKTTTHNVSVSGGLEKGGYRLSLGYQELEGVLLYSKTKRTSLNYSMNKSLLNDAIQVKFHTKNAFTDDVFSSNQVGSALSFDPTQPIYDTASIYGGYFEYNNTLAGRNPVAEIEERKEIGSTFRSLSSVELRYNIPYVKGLALVTNVSYDVQNGERRRFSPTYLRSENTDNTPGSFGVESYSRKSYLTEIYGNYKKEITSLDLSINLTGGYSYQNFINTFNKFSVDSLVTNVYGVDNPSVGEGSVITPLYRTLENRLISFYGRSIFSLKDKYVLTATIRRDGSTKFGGTNQWGVFPSLAFAWRISNESFFEPLENVITYMKFRASYGITGFQELEDYTYIAAYRYSGAQALYQFGNQYYSTLRPEAQDPNIQWEETASVNIGMDYELFNGKISGAIDVYQKNTSKLINSVPPPVGTYTKDRILTNIGETRNQGIEFEINSPIVKTQDISVNIGFNAAYNINKIVSLDFSGSKDSQQENTKSNIAGDVGQTIKTWKVGEPVNSFNVYEQIYGEDGRPVYDIINKTNMYVDQNDDGLINEKDLIAGLSSDPKIILGMTSNLRYKAFDMAFTLRSNIGNYVYNNVASNYGHFLRINGDLPYNMHTSVLETKFGAAQLKSDYYVEKASFLKLDNISIGYTLDKLDWMRARIYVTGQNLLTLSGYSGLNPEISTGIDNNLYPRSVTVIGGINLTF